MVIKELLIYENPAFSDLIKKPVVFCDEFLAWLETLDDYLLYWNIEMKDEYYLVYNCVIEFSKKDAMMFRLKWS